MLSGSLLGAALAAAAVFAKNGRVFFRCVCSVSNEFRALSLNGATRGVVHARARKAGAGQCLRDVSRHIHLTSHAVFTFDLNTSIVDWIRQIQMSLLPTNPVTVR